MKSLNGVAVAAAWSALAAGGAAHAQEAVQWRVEDGGNGHWYLAVPCTTGYSADEAAIALGGQLVSITSSLENDFVRQILAASGRQFAMLGLIQADNQPAPDAGWSWTSGEPLGYANWTDFDGAYGFSAPDDRPCAGPTAIEDNQCNQGLMYLDGRWDDVERGASCAGFASSSVAVVEYSADCNGDGIVDYGQCRDGSLPDYNGNNIPDCCEQGVPCEVGNYPVQWRIEDGGNGHWYYRLDDPLTTWDACRATALGVGADLASLASAHEYSVIRRLVTDAVASSLPKQLWLGGVASVGSAGTGGWQWSDGTPWAFDAWCSVSPNNPGTQARYLIHYTDWDCWDDYYASDACCHMRGAVIEWSADCNGDGIVDYGQILLGELGDSNANGVPDVCECDADINDDGTVNGADISVLLGYWGQSGKGVVGDITGDGIVNGADLAQLLGSWGPCQ